MKRIILGLSMLLIVVQNGFALSDEEFDKQINNAPNKALEQMQKCNKASGNHKYTSDVNICLKAVNMLKDSYPNEKKAISTLLSNTAVLYDNSEKNYVKAYEYFMKSAKLGNINAQRNLDVMCNKHSWVCK